MARTCLETNLETIQVIDQMIGKEMVEKILNRNPTNIVNIVIKMDNTWKYFWEMQANVNKAKGIRRLMLAMMIHQTHSTLR